MSLYSIQDTTLTDIADAIRSKTGKTASMTPIEMPDEIASISGGGSATLITKTITANGTYSAEDDDADGYSEVTVNVPTGITPTGTLNITENDTYDVTNYASAIVNVPSGGSSAWTKIAETSYQVSTTNTSATTLETWATGHSEIWTSDKILYVRIRDTAGKRAGYFYGTDAFFLNYTTKNRTSTNTVNGLVANFWSVSPDGTYGQRYGFSSTGYGVYPNQFYSDGRIRFATRYESSYSRTINGTYKVEVYLLDPAGGAPIFE